MYNIFLYGLQLKSCICGTRGVVRGVRRGRGVSDHPI